MTPSATSAYTPHWSFTRDQALRSCPRQYYFKYHLAAAGRRRGASLLERRALALSRLTSLDQVLGIAVHQCARQIAQAVGRKMPHPSLDALSQRVRLALNRAYAASREVAVRPHPLFQLASLREFHYRGGVTRQSIERIRTKAACCLANLTELPLWEALRKCRGEDVRIIDRPQRFEYRGVPALAAPDLVFRGPDGAVVIIDWKTGRERAIQEAAQVAVYGLFLANTHPELMVRIPEAQIVHLDQGTLTKYEITAERLDAAGARLMSGAIDLREAASAVQRLGETAREKFPLTACRAQCSYCNFLELCEPELRG